MPQHLLRRGRRYSIGEYGINPVDPFITAWANSVVVNGGAFPSANTLIAMTSFYRGLGADGLLSKLNGLNCFVPDNLIACQTPLIVGNGFSLWTNMGGNFNSTDLSVNGLVGNASNKTLNTGINPSLFSLQSGSGYSWYTFSTTATGFSLGCYDGIHNFIGATKYTDNNSYGYNSGSSALNVVTVASSGPGYYSDLRVSTTDHRLFFANTGNAHAQIGTTDSLAESGSLLSQPMYVFCVNLTNGATQLQSSDRISFVAMHSGFTSTDSANLFSRIQTLRFNFGGGYV